MKNFTPIANPAVVHKPVDDGWAILINLDTHHSMAINPTTRLIWQAVDGQRDVEHIVAFIKNQFTDLPEQVEEDVHNILDLFEKQGYIGKELLWK